MAQLFELETSALPDESLVISFRGVERLSAPYRFEVFVSAPVDGLDLSSATSLKATLSIGTREPPYQFHGLVESAEIVEQTSADRALVRVVIAPRIRALAHSRHSRVFTDKAITDVIGDIFDEAGLTTDDFDLRLNGSYAAQEHICQYKESDLAFLSRWFEREGIYFFFEQGESAEKVIIADDKSAHVPLGAEKVRYDPSLGQDSSAGEALRFFACRKRVVPGKIKVKDYDYARPQLDVSGEAPVATPGSSAQQTEIVDYGLRFFTPADGKHLASVRAEEQAARQTVFEGRGRVFHLRPGYTFEVEDHPRSAFDQEYLCTALEHAGNERATTPEMRQLTGAGADPYVVTVHAVAKAVQWRAPFVTQWPVVPGTERATVDGAAESDYAQVDGDGRYQLKFGFDESALKDGKASTAIRMMQPHAGNPEGFHLPQRKGTEVMVAFLGGDPDRPVIAATVPNAVTPSPVTVVNHTRNILHTGCDNHLEIEDLAGKQWFDLRTPPKTTFMHLGQPHGSDSHYVVLNTGGDCLFEIGTNQDITVGKKLTETVKGAVIEEYHTSQTTKVKGTQTTIVKSAVEESYTGGQATTTTGLVLELYDSTQTTTVSGGPRDERYDDSQTTITTGGVDQKFTTGQHVMQTGPSLQLHDGTYQSVSTGPCTESFTGPILGVHGATTRTTAAVTWTVDGGVDIFTGSWSLTQTSASILSQAVTELAITGTQGTGLSLQIGVLNFGAIAFCNQIFGLKLAVQGLTANFYIGNITLAAVSVDTDAATVKAAGTASKA